MIYLLIQQTNTQPRDTCASNFDEVIPGDIYKGYTILIPETFSESVLCMQNPSLPSLHLF